MSGRIGPSNNATKGSGKQSFQSAWMAHWMKPTHIAAAEICTSSRNEDLDYARRDTSLLNELEVPKSTKGVGLLETKSFKILNDSPRKGSKSSANEGMHSSHLKPGKDTNEVRTSFSRDVERGQGMISNNGLLFLPMNSEIPISNGTASGGYRGEGTSKNPLGWMKTHPSAIGSSFAASKPVQELLVESSSCVVPYRFDIGKCKVDKGKAVAVSPLMSRSAAFSNNLPDGNMRKLEQGNCHNLLESADLAHDRRMDSHSQLHNPTPAHFTENKTSLFSEAPSTSDLHLPQFNQGWFQKMNKYSSLGLFPVQCVAPEKTKAKKSHCDPYSLQKFPDCVHDVDTMRICTMVDSVVGMPGGCPMFAQTTHSLLVTKKTDANLSKENETFRSTRVITKINEKTCNEPCGPSSFFDQGNRGLKLQALSSSSESEGKGNVGGVKVVKVTRRNESSAETDTLDMNSLKEKISPNGTNSTASTKGINVKSYLPPWVNAASSREAMIHDINLKPPGLPVPASLSENMGPTSSRTQSLEMDMLLAHAEQPKPKFNLNLEYSTKADASNRWVKRLKLNSLSAQITKSSNLGENLSHAKMSKYFSKTLKNSFTSSEPSLSKHHGRESMDKDRDLSKEDRDFPVAKKDAKLVLSHAWIQRWLSNESRVAQKKPGEMVACESLSSKFEMEDLEKKQFPSIAAMALMGKAMSGFQPCELQKRGSFTVWNTKAF